LGTLELGRELKGRIFGSDTEVMKQARKRRIARVYAVGGTQGEKFVKGVTSKLKLCQSLKRSQK
jgi:hypothetical protein